MKQKINIYCSKNLYFFVEQLLKEYNLSFQDIENSSFVDTSKDLGIIFINKENKIDKSCFKNLTKNYILVSDLNDEFFEGSTNFIFLKSPVSIDQIKNEITKYFSSNNTYFEDFVISEKKIINTENNLSCYLTDIEKDILVYLINDKNIKKNKIKKNILKINETIQSNSLESHLTRIRKKFEKIKTRTKISTKNDVLSIFI